MFIRQVEREASKVKYRHPGNGMVVLIAEDGKMTVNDVGEVRTILNMIAAFLEDLARKNNLPKDYYLNLLAEKPSKEACKR